VESEQEPFPEAKQYRDTLEAPEFLRLIAELELSTRQSLARCDAEMTVGQSFRIQADFVDGFEHAAAAAMKFYTTAPTLEWEETVSRLALVTLPKFAADLWKRIMRFRARDMDSVFGVMPFSLRTEEQFMSDVRGRCAPYAERAILEIMAKGPVDEQDRDKSAEAYRVKAINDFPKALSAACELEMRSAMQAWRAEYVSKYAFKLTRAQQKELQAILFSGAERAAKPVCGDLVNSPEPSEGFKFTIYSLSGSDFPSAAVRLWNEVTMHAFLEKGALPFGIPFDAPDYSADDYQSDVRDEIRMHVIARLGPIVDASIIAHMSRPAAPTPADFKVPALYRVERQIWTEGVDWRDITFGTPPPDQLPAARTTAPTPEPVAQNGAAEDGPADPFATPGLRAAAMDLVVEQDKLKSRGELMRAAGVPGKEENLRGIADRWKRDPGLLGKHNSARRKTIESYLLKRLKEIYVESLSKASFQLPGAEQGAPLHEVLMPDLVRWLTERQASPSVSQDTRLAAGNTPG